nr:glucose 1-dehydrogenase [Sphingomonas sp. Y57]
MTGKFDGKVVLVTGGSSGIGLAAAKRFAAEGALMVIAGRRQEQLDAAVKEVGEGTLAVRADVSSLSDLDVLIDRIRERHGRLDIVFANAGAAGAPTPMQQLTEADYNEIFDQNVKSVLFTVQKALPLLADGGAVVITSSIAHIKGIPGATLYGASKAAIRSFARTWSNEFKGRRIRVNVISPGPTKTPLHADIEANPNAAEAVAGMLRMIPAGRMAEPEEIAAAAVFLASPDASFITGVELYADGGLAQI